MGRPGGLERLWENADLDLLVSWELRPEIELSLPELVNKSSDGAHTESEKWLAATEGNSSYTGYLLYFLILAAQPPPGASLILNFIVRFTCIFTSL